MKGWGSCGFPISLYESFAVTTQPTTSLKLSSCLHLYPTAEDHWGSSSAKECSAGDMRRTSVRMHRPPRWVISLKAQTFKGSEAVKDEENTTKAVGLLLSHQTPALLQQLALTWACSVMVFQSECRGWDQAHGWDIWQPGGRLTDKLKSHQLGRWKAVRLFKIPGGAWSGQEEAVGCSFCMEGSESEY